MTRILAAAMALAPLAASARPPLPPAVGRCAVARLASLEVEIPADARVVSMGPGADGRPWACWVVARVPPPAPKSKAP